jgi:hypothetical protein
MAIDGRLVMRGNLVTLVFCLAFAGFSQAQSQGPFPSDGQQTTPQQTEAHDKQGGPGDERGTESAPLIVRAIKSKEEAAKDEQDRKDKAFNDYITIFLSAAVAIGTVLQATALIIIISTTRRQLRAYVIVSGYNIDQRKADGRFVVSFRLKNTGQTPARELTVTSKTTPMAHPVNKEFYFRLDEGKDPSRSLVGPGEEIEHDSLGDEISDMEMEMVLAPDGPLRLYTWGTVTYRDIFQWRWQRRRVTNFCQFVIWDHRGNAVGQASEHHNDGN